MHSHLYRVLEDKINQRLQTLADSLADGAAANYENYKYQVGFRAGLKEALTICGDIEGEQSE